MDSVALVAYFLEAPVFIGACFSVEPARYILDPLLKDHTCVGLDVFLHTTFNQKHLAYV